MDTTQDEEHPIFIERTKRSFPTPTPKDTSTAPPLKRLVRQEEYGPAISPEELEMLKRQYRGGLRESRKILRPSEKFKTPNLRDLLATNENDDTTRDPNELYSNPLELRPLFGRGFAGGLGAPIQKAKPSGSRFINDWREKPLDEMTEKDWQIMREDLDINAKGNDNIKPLRTWGEARLSKDVLGRLREIGYETPTAIQRAAIPGALEMRDVLGLAETGSGKTAAYVIPMLEYVLRMPEMTAESAGGGPYALVLAPTRELAMQIEKETLRIGKPLGVRVCCCVGGVPMQEQIRMLSRGVEVVVAAPGRLQDLVAQSYVVFGQCFFVVLDEADKMLEMGLDVQVRAILSELPPLKDGDAGEIKRQELANCTAPKTRTTMMFSATMRPEILRLAAEYLRRPLTISIGQTNNVASRVRQVVEWVPEGEKRARLIRAIQRNAAPIIVFVNLQRAVDEMVELLHSEGIRCVGIHGGKPQAERTEALEGFRRKKWDVVVATNVLSRGIDVENVATVINFDMPRKIDEYTHRVGRTGRNGKGGVALSFVNGADGEVLLGLKTQLQASKAKIPPELDQWLYDRTLI